MKILLVTDAWKPQMNGVVRTLTRTVEELISAGHEVEVIAPGDGYRTMPVPTYPDIRMAPFARKDVRKRMIGFRPHAVHIATEGPLGLAARKFCLKWRMPYTTSYHTKFPEYIKARFPFMPLGLMYKFVRNFHNKGQRMMVTTPSMVEFLKEKGFENPSAWGRGVDLEQFNPAKRLNPGDVYKNLPRPIFVNVGRIAVEKNIETFLELDLPGTKIVVGKGPQEEELKKKYPNTIFAGAKFGEELARYYADADVFVFPSLTDTFGLVIIEAMATGTPVAGFPISGPIDIIPGSNAGFVSDDLRQACLDCLKIDRAVPAEHARNYSWQKVSEKFINMLAPEDDDSCNNRWDRLQKKYS
ncbi:MAG: glycosyltransferase family 1 protein [Hellea sp.]|nr:glycosyltransferase family 1 protein [Hellea sp.]